MGRTEKSYINVLIAFITNGFLLVINFITQRFFVKYLGQEYTGINGLFTSIISMLSITELGIGTAIIYNLYYPVKNEDYYTINCLMAFYKKSYKVIAIVLGTIGLLILPTLNYWVGKHNINDNIYYVFILFLIDSLCSYFLAYKKSLIIAYQQNYIVEIIHFVSILAQNIFQIIALVNQKYIIYLYIRILAKLLENICISIYTNKKFKFLNDDCDYKLDKSIKDDIFTKVKALLYHRIGGFFVLGSDNLLLTKLFGLSEAAKYANYNMVLSGFNLVLKKIFDVLTSSVGNLLIEKDKTKNRLIFKKIEFMNFVLFGMATVGFVAIHNSFIKLWVGKHYVFNNAITFVLMINFFLQSMRSSIDTFKNAAGIYYEDRYVPFLEAFVNVLMSIIMGKLVGTSGIFLGTIISSGVLFLYSYPKYVCKPLLNIKYQEYVLSLVKYLSIVVATIFMTNGLFRFIKIKYLVVDIVVKGAISEIIFIMLIFIVYSKQEEFIYFVSMAKKIIKEKKRIK